MMAADSALISEIVLFSFGFVESRLLARKIVAAFDMSTEQLTSQPQYVIVSCVQKTNCIIAMTSA